MIFDVLKNRWLRKQQEIYRGRERDRRQSAPSSLVIIYDADAHTATDMFTQWTHDLKIKQPTLIGFTSDKNAISTEEKIMITPSSLKWTGGIADSKLKNILEQSFDLQINYYTHAPVMPSFVALALRSSLKVGFPSQEEEQYDLAIDTSLNQRELFFTELRRYLKIITN
jgi:hypothetical protein